MKKEVQYRTLRWGPCVVQYTIDEEFRKILLEEAKKSHVSYGHRLAGHLKKEVKMDSSRLTKYFDEVFHVYNHALSMWLGKTQNLQYILTDLWCNFQKANEFNPPHNHGGLLSFVITNNSFFPQEGEMFIFPAWLKHWVFPYKSDVTRISVSGNIVDSLELKYMSQDGVKSAIKDIESKHE